MFESYAKNFHTYIFGHLAKPSGIFQHKVRYFTIRERGKLLDGKDKSTMEPHTWEKREVHHAAVKHTRETRNRRLIE